MAEPVPIIADPISSDGSEESWILLDEMDEAMNEEVNSSQNLTEVIEQQATSTEPMHEANEIEVANEAVAMSEVNAADYPSNVETIRSDRLDDDCPSIGRFNYEDEDDDDVNDAAHLRSSIENNQTLQLYDELNDGSTTEGSISIIGDHENNQDRFDSDDLSIHAPSPQPLQMWMRCTPIDVTYCQESVNPYPELTFEPPNLIEGVMDYLNRLNHFLSNIYMLQVILLFITAASVAVLAIIYSRYSACKLDYEDLEHKLYTMKLDKYQIEGNLAQCEYLYEMEVEKTTNSEFKLATDNGDQKMPAVHSQTNCQTNDLNGECVIQPTRLSENHIKDANIKLQTVWTADNLDEVLTSNKPYKTKDDNYLPECDDENSLFFESDRKYCELQKIKEYDQKDRTVYATHYSYKTIDDRECNPNKMDFSMGIEHAKQILHETNCDDDGTMKYLQKAYENYRTKLKTDQTKIDKDHKKMDKSNGKWNKTQKFNNSIIKIDKYEAELRFDHNEQKERRDKKQQKETERKFANLKENKENKKHQKEREREFENNKEHKKHQKEKEREFENNKEHKKHQKEKERKHENNKENKRKNDRKDATTKYQPEKDKDSGKWNKNDQKRDMVKVYDHRHND